MKILLNKLFFLFRGKVLPKLPPLLQKAVISSRNIFLKHKIDYNNLIEEISAREQYSIFNISGLSTPLPPYPYSVIPENNYYGNGIVLSDFADTIKNYTTVVEHGVFFGNYIPKDYNIYKTIITFSERRKRILTKRFPNKRIIVVGPYINYAESLPLIESDLNAISKFNKTLLVFPAHSVNSAHAKFNIDNLINYIKTFRDEMGFETVIVCMYWKDVLLETYSYYQKEEMQVVTAGHIYDPNFLRRLKTIISLSDYVLTNSIGTHLGYCAHLNKPIHVFDDQSMRYIAGENRDKAQILLNIRDENETKVYNSDVREIRRVFSSKEYFLTEPQKECILEYWGKDKI